MPVNDVLQASLRFSINGEKTANVLHFIQTSADGALPPNEDLAAAIIEDLWPSLKACLSDDCTLQSIAVKRIDPTLGGTTFVPVIEPGSVGQDTLPPNGCLVVTLYTNTLTKRGRGRMFISGIPDTFINQGRLNNADATVFVTFLDLLLSAIQGGAGATFHAAIWSATAGSAQEITSHQLRARLINLRGRRMANP